MSRGLYTAASGMLAGMQRQLALSNQLANVNTTGFKADQTTTRAFSGVLAQAGGGGGQLLRALAGSGTALGSGAQMERTGTDLRPGLLRTTGRGLDVALDGEGFFVAEGEDGRLRLTRDGHFLVNSEGFLTTAQGDRLLSATGGPLTAGAGTVTFGSEGDVLVDGEPVGRLRVATAEAGALLRAGGSSFVVTDEGALEDVAARTVAGTLEESNVNTTATLTAMVDVARAYESSQRIFAMQSQILSQTASEVGRV